MPGPISTDLRRRIVEAYLSGGGTYAEIAGRFGVGEATVSRLLRLAREKKTVEPKPWSGGPDPFIRDEDLAELRELVAQNPGGTRQDFCDAWRERKGVRMSVASMGRALARAGITRKRSKYRPTERLRPEVEDRRKSFIEELQEKDPEKLVFLDESGCNIAMTPRYGWAPRGRPAVQYKPANWGSNVTVVAAITMQGPIAHDHFEGAMNSHRFLAFIADELCPALLPGDIVIMDNLRPHHTAGVREAIEAQGADLIYLPPYSPDLNPIEPMWGVIKQWLRAMKARTLDRLFSLVETAFDAVDSAHFPAWFAHCGYHQPSRSAV